MCGIPIILCVVDMELTHFPYIQQWMHFPKDLCTKILKVNDDHWPQLYALFKASVVSSSAKKVY